MNNPQGGDPLQSMPLPFLHSRCGGTSSGKPQCSTILPASTRYRWPDSAEPAAADKVQPGRLNPTTCPLQPSIKASANETAAAACFIFGRDNRVIRSPIWLLGTVWRLSKFTAQVCGSPSSSVSTTSVGMLRTVEVSGAMVTEFRMAIADSRVRIRTGRLL